MQIGQNGVVGGPTGAGVATGAAVGSMGKLGQPQTLPAAAAACAIAHCVFVTPLMTNACASAHVYGLPGNCPNNAMTPSGFCKSNPPSRHKVQLTSGCNVGKAVGAAVGGAVGVAVGSDVGLKVGALVGDAVVGWRVGSVSNMIKTIRQ